MKEQMNIGALTVAVTTEQIRAAPPEVRRWLYELIGAEAPAGRIVERDGFRATEEGLAILGEGEARALIARLEADPVATALLVQFACDCWDPQSGKHYAHRVGVADILRRTPIASPVEVRQHLERIDAALREGRGDGTTTLFEGNAHLGYSVHSQTQAILHRLHSRPLAEVSPAGLEAPRPAAEAAD